LLQIKRTGQDTFLVSINFETSCAD